MTRPTANDKVDPIAAADHDPAQPLARLDAAEILASVGGALYRWDIKSDVLIWSPNAADVIHVSDIGAVGSGRAYAQLLEPDTTQAPFDAIVTSVERDEGQGVPYQIQYAIRPDPEADTRLWVEDTGRWFAGPDGKPIRAQAIT
jgi:hypothetical protein